MKNIINRIALASMILAMSLVANAQVDVDIDLGTKEWYEQPIYWVLGVVVLILVAVLARRKK